MLCIAMLPNNDDGDNLDMVTTMVTVCTVSCCSKNITSEALLTVVVVIDFCGMNE